MLRIEGVAVQGQGHGTSSSSMASSSSVHDGQPFFLGAGICAHTVTIVTSIGGAVL